MAQDYSKMSNGELFGLLRQRGLSHIGTKADIVARLQKDDAQKTPADAQAVAPEEHTKDLGDEIGATAISEAVVAAVSEDTLNSLSPVVRHTIYDCLGFPVNKNRKLRLQFHDWQLGELPVRSHYIFADGQGELAITQDEYELNPEQYKKSRKSTDSLHGIVGLSNGALALMFVNKFLRDELYSILYSDAMFTFLFNISRNPARLVLKSHALSHLTHVTLGPLQHFSHGKHHGVLRSADLELPFATLRIEQLARSIDFVRSKCPKLQILITMLGSCDVRETWPLPEPDVNKRAGEVLVTTHQTKEGTKAVPWRRERYQKMRFQGKIKTPVMWNDGPVEDPERMKELERKEKKQKKRKIGGRARHPDELGKGSEDDDQPMEVEQKPWVAPQERREPSEEEKQRTRDAECFKQATRFEPISYALSRLAEEVPSLQALALGVGRDVHSTLRPSQVKGSKCAIEVGQWAFFEFGKLKENVIARSSWDF